jgi:hypothetical protein
MSNTYLAAKFRAAHPADFCQLNSRIAGPTGESRFEVDETVLEPIIKSHKPKTCYLLSSRQRHSTPSYITPIML